MKCVTRINLKTACKNRKELINFCLNNEKQYLVIGWSYIYKKYNGINNYKVFYDDVKSDVKRINHAFNSFLYTDVGALFWTRDLDGYYWICRAIGKAEHYLDLALDIGARVPVKAYRVGMEVPGQIKASFNRPNGGVAEDIHDDVIISYSQYIYNKKSGSNLYDYNVDSNKENLLDNLPDFDLEELVIAYLQIKKDYYVLSNSIANKSTTIKIECELISRNKGKIEKAVVQVKGGKTKTIDALDYKSYIDDGYKVFLFAPTIKNSKNVTGCTEITKKELMNFYNEYKMILPESITKWENIFNS